MGITGSTNAGYQKTGEATIEDGTKPRFARLYHSWLGYALFLWQLVMALFGATQIFNWWTSYATVVLLSFIVITLCVYIFAMWFNYGYYGATFTTRRHLNLEREECWKICNDEPTFSVVIARDLKFHSDQTHFTWVCLVYGFLLCGFAGWLIQQGTANPSPDFNVVPTIYDPVSFLQYIVVKIVQFTVVAIAGACGLLLLKTESCFLHSTLVSLNNDMIANTTGRGLRTPVEHDMASPNTVLPPMVEQKGRYASSSGGQPLNSITTKNYF